MTKSILCAVDISEVGADTDVLETAAKLAAVDGAQLDVITIVPDYGMSLVGSFFNEDQHQTAMNEAKRRLETMCETTLGPEANTKVRHVVSSGKVYEEVIKTAEHAGTDLIIVGANKSDLKDFLLGPNAARIVRHSNCSVYVVR